MLDVKILKVHAQVMHCEVSLKHKAPVCISIVYGMNTVTERKEMWKELANCKTQAPWLITGDFNAVLHMDDRHNGNPITTFKTWDFEDFIDDAELFEIKSKDSFYSWTNKGQGARRVASRIDRGLGNKEWMDLYGHVEVFCICLLTYLIIVLSCISVRMRLRRVEDHSDF